MTVKNKVIREKCGRRGFKLQVKRSTLRLKKETEHGWDNDGDKNNKKYMANEGSSFRQKGTRFDLKDPSVNGTMQRGDGKAE